MVQCSGLALKVWHPLIEKSNLLLEPVFGKPDPVCLKCLNTKDILAQKQVFKQPVMAKRSAFKMLARKNYCLTNRERNSQYTLLLPKGRGHSAYKTGACPKMTLGFVMITLLTLTENLKSTAHFIFEKLELHDEPFDSTCGTPILFKPYQRRPPWSTFRKAISAKGKKTI